MPAGVGDFFIMVRGGGVEVRVLAETDWELGKGRTVIGQFQPDNSTHPRYHRRPHQRHPNDPMRTFGSFLIECVCISQQLTGMRKSLSSCVSQSLCLNPSLDFPSCFLHLHLLRIFLKFLHSMYFSEFTAVFAHYSKICILPYLIARICFLSVKMHCHVGQTNRPCLV